MTNREVARVFNKLAKVMELHGENQFKIRSYANAYNTIRRGPEEVMELDRAGLLSIPGIGKNIADKIEELRDTGNINTLQKYLDKTPPGIVELLSVKGFGAKKILTVWKELGIETPGELLYACQENRLVDLKGFGAKSQATLEAQLVYFLDAQGKYLFGHILEEVTHLFNYIISAFSEDKFSFIGDVHRQMPVVDQVEIIGTATEEEVLKYVSGVEGYSAEEGQHDFRGTKFSYKKLNEVQFGDTLFKGSCSPEFLTSWVEHFGPIEIKSSEEDLFDSLGLEYIPPESRELPEAITKAKAHALSLIDHKDIRGVVHNHSTYSDGAHSVKDMANACIELGYEYLVMTDHSQSAFYANGLKEEAVYEQMAEIDDLNKEYKGFQIFKGIESDILYDGQLDYEDEVLELFDVVIASVHSNLKMDVVKATDRIIRAVNNPFTRILGHPTGRLLLSREGYPLDHKAVIDACAANEVIIELNANPYRLDLDWTWIPYSLEKGVKISINPDAHSITGINNIAHGVRAARKALMRPEDCLNTMGLVDFTKWVGDV